MENMSIVHGNKHKLSCVEEKGHCSERIDSLEPRVILEGIERLLWPVGLALCYFGARVETRDQ